MRIMITETQAIESLHLYDNQRNDITVDFIKTVGVEGDFDYDRDTATYSCTQAVYDYYVDVIQKAMELRSIFNELIEKIGFEKAHDLLLDTPQYGQIDADLDAQIKTIREELKNENNF
jgi:hypothetical protein